MLSVETLLFSQLTELTSSVHVGKVLCSPGPGCSKSD